MVRPVIPVRKRNCRIGCAGDIQRLKYLICYYNWFPDVLPDFEMGGSQSTVEEVKTFIFLQPSVD